MKNIHLLPTDKPSRLYEDVDCDLRLGYDFIVRQGMLQNQHIYITSDEEIKERDYIISLVDDESFEMVWKCDESQIKNIIDFDLEFKKIILTTDQDLIKDGVQSIDDTFLEWFVKNPSCEKVDVNDWLDDNGNIAFGGDKRYQICNHIYDKIIIPQEELKQIKCYCGHTITCDCSLLEEPKQNCKHCKQSISKYGCACAKQKEEPKQETLEEVAEHNYPGGDVWTEEQAVIRRIAFKNGANYQAERMYSEEDMIEFAEFVATYLDKNKNINGQILHAKSKYDGSERTVDLLEQFKKK